MHRTTFPIAGSGAGVFRPTEDEPGAELIDASDHRLVRIDVAVPATDSAR